jgi:hypothetical protein
MSLADVIYNALTGQSGAARPTFSDAIRDVVQERTARGISRKGFARDVGIPESTLRRWEKGARPTAKDFERRHTQLIAAHRHLVAVPSMLDRWRDHNMRFTLDGFPEHGRSVSRNVSGHQLELAPGTGDRIVNAFLAGDDKGAARALGAGITNHFYDLVFNQWLDDEDLSYEGHDTGDSDYTMTVSAA